MDALDHQQAALQEITARARAYFAGQWMELPIRPRWASLLVGPSGSGKTTIATMAAARLSETIGGLEVVETVSTLRVSAPAWMPCGAHNRGTRETISVIAEHVAAHPKTILVVDEIDKLIGGVGGIGGTGDQSWQSYIRGEIYDLLDSRWPTGLQSPDNLDDDDESSAEIPIELLSRRLREGVFILAIGTFQRWFDGAQDRRSMGFGAELSSEQDELSADIIAEKMPRELANRFHAGIVRLPELAEADYHRIAREAESKLPERMRELFRHESEKRIASAIAAKKGVRFLEEALTSVLVKLSKEPQPSAIPPVIDTCSP